jgi:glyoxylase-like metal-dependent hydrolase (beta-lactamase superfamily II)
LEVCFVDVGQGSSNLILLGRKRAIVIDAGGRHSGTVIRLLQHFQIESLARLIVTHNYDDHSRGAANLLTAYSWRIEEVWCLHDDGHAGGERLQPGAGPVLAGNSGGGDTATAGPAAAVGRPLAPPIHAAVLADRAYPRWPPYAALDALVSGDTRKREHRCSLRCIG